MILESLIIGELLAVGDRFVSEHFYGSLSYRKAVILMEFAPSDLKRFQIYLLIFFPVKFH
jgi:hypothetical protein